MILSSRVSYRGSGLRNRRGYSIIFKFKSPEDLNELGLEDLNDFVTLDTKVFGRSTKTPCEFKLFCDEDTCDV